MNSKMFLYWFIWFPYCLTSGMLVAHLTIPHGSYLLILSTIVLIQVNVLLTNVLFSMKILQLFPDTKPHDLP